ncbi:methionyl-tRNA formyltransferase [Candidatus Palauibacter sp.]|uniref:methionyl-tRNA formyltransferase n=1 Tax=Candidatus Palauibacter sp. TaxID=3101350 RepID=UPI003B51F78F
MRVLFWGTPEFGLPSLEAMRGAGHDIAGVVTNPDRPAGRGRRPRASPVKAWALEAGVPVLQPERPGKEGFLAAARRLRPDISVVAAYGRLLPPAALDLPPFGSVNVHASLLPALRGAAPINWAIIRGHRESGVSIQRMVAELDAGPVLRQTRIPIPAAMTAGELYAETAEAGGARLVTVLDDLASGRAVERAQDHARATWAPKLNRETARIDWSRPAAEVANWLRGCDPWPAAWTSLAAPAVLAGRTLQCFEPSVDAPGAEDGLRAGGAHAGSSRSGTVSGTAPGTPPGTVVRADPVRGLRVATGSGTISIGAVKPAGRRRMSAAEWVRGLPDPKEVRFD